MLRNPLFKFLLPLLAVGIILFGGWLWLRNYTKHNDARRVPDMKGLFFEEAQKMLAERDLTGSVIDSIYTDDVPKGSVVDQDPAAGLDVKPGRKIYLVLNASQAKMINMPKLVDLSKRQAISVMDIIGLKVEELQYRPDPCVDCVIAQVYKGKPILPESRIRRGEALTLVLGQGQNGSRVPVPDLRGLTNAEVQAVLNMSSLNLGVIATCDGCNTGGDSAFARVRRQSPGAGANNMISLGSTIDIWLTADTTGLHPDADRSISKDSTNASN